MSLHLQSIIESPARLIVFFVLFLLVRGLPALLLYRRELPPRGRVQLMLLTSTALPLLVALAAIGLEVRDDAARERGRSCRGRCALSHRVSRHRHQPATGNRPPARRQASRRGRLSRLRQTAKPLIPSTSRETWPNATSHPDADVRVSERSGATPVRSSRGEPADVSGPSRESFAVTATFPLKEIHGDGPESVCPCLRSWTRSRSPTIWPTVLGVGGDRLKKKS